jgi:hypothetical protein
VTDTLSRSASSTRSGGLNFSTMLARSQAVESERNTETVKLGGSDQECVPQPPAFPNPVGGVVTAYTEIHGPA